MKLQFMEMDLEDRSHTHLHPPIEVNSFEEAIRKQMFKPGYKVEQYEIDQFLAEFVEEENMFIADGDTLCSIFFKL